MCVHHTKNYRRGLLRLEFEARGGVSGWIGKSGSDEGGNRPDQEGQQKHLSKEKLDWRESPCFGDLCKLRDSCAAVMHLTG